MFTCLRVGLDIHQSNSGLFGPVLQCATDIFRAIIHAYGQWFATPAYDPVQRSDNPLCGQREVHLDSQSLAIKVIQNIQGAERAAVY